jgi:YbbR domain-containing protein
LRSKGLGKRLLAEWPAKVLSLAAALLLFFFYRLNRLEYRYVSVPLAVTFNEEYLPSSQLPKSVRVTLRGESNALFSIQEDDIRATLDLSSYRGEGAFRVPVLIEKGGTALGVDPLEIAVDPAEAAVSIERRASRVLPVTPSFKGFLETGYEMVNFVIMPPEVEVYGPAGAVARLTDIQTDFIELTGRSADFQTMVKLERKDGLVYISGPENVDFRATVQQSIAVKTFSGIALEASGLAPDLVLRESLPTASLILRSSSADISGFEPLPGFLTVDFSGISAPGTYGLDVIARLPAGLVVEKLDPLRVTVVVARRSDP